MSLLLAEGEQVVRKYRCAVVDYKSSDNSLDATGLVRKRPDTDGLVVVTNKRVLYYAEADNALVVYVDAQAWGTNLTMMREILRTRMEFQGARVSKIVVRVSREGYRRR